MDDIPLADQKRKEPPASEGPSKMAASSNNASAVMNHANRLRDKIQSKLHSEQMQRRRQQAGNALKNLGSQLQKTNLAKLIDQMESDQSLADSLEKLNARMKEECERQEIRREAEARSMEVIQDHLEVFLQERPNATYEDWIEDLHPENANQGKLLSDLQEIDQRFYVYESDHRKLWNDAMEKLDASEHRIVEARSQIWGTMSQNGYQKGSDPVDLISGSADFSNSNSNSTNNELVGLKETETESVDFFDSGSTGNAGSSPFTSENNDEPSEDLIQL